MDGLKTWARVNSPWVLHFNSGSCNGCDIEILATLTPRYDLERFGVKLQASPRHADVLLCTGPVTRQARERAGPYLRADAGAQVRGRHRLLRLSGGAFQGCYNVMGGIDKVIPVNAYIPGCPPRPEAIIDGVVKLLTSLMPGWPAASHSPARSRKGRYPMNTEEILGLAEDIVQSWDWATEVSRPRPELPGCEQSRPINELIPIIVGLRVKRLGYLSAIVGIDLGPEANEMEVLYHFCPESAVITLRVRVPRDERRPAQSVRDHP